jgi:hypothetical protein
MLRGAEHWFPLKESLPFFIHGAQGVRSLSVLPLTRAQTQPTH